MKNKELLILYSVFAIIVTITNLSSQRLVLSFLTGNVRYFAALFTGTWDARAWSSSWFGNSIHT